MRKVWKAVASTGTGTEWVSIGVYGARELIYKPGEVKHHKNMFVFKSLEEAIASEARYIWEAETIEAHKAPERILKVGAINELFEAFWCGDDIIPIYLQNAPAGTLLCDDLRLIKEVYRKAYNEEAYNEEDYL